MTNRFDFLVDIIPTSVPGHDARGVAPSFDTNFAADLLALSGGRELTTSGVPQPRSERLRPGLEPQSFNSFGL